MFEATRGKGFKGDIALDEIKLTPGTCEAPKTSTPAPSTTPAVTTPMPTTSKVLQAKQGEIDFQMYYFENINRVLLFQALIRQGINPLRPNNDVSQTSHCNIKGV